MGKESLRLASAVLWLTILVIVLLNILQSRGIQQGHPPTRRKHVPPSGALPEFDHQSLWESVRGKENWVFPPLRTVHSQGKFNHNQRPPTSQSQLAGTKQRNKIYTPMVSKQPKQMLRRPGTSITDLTHSMIPLFPTPSSTSQRGMTQLSFLVFKSVDPTADCKR